MLNSRPNENNALIKNNIRSIPTNHQLKNSCKSDIFTDDITDESFEFFNESDESKITQQSLLTNSRLYRAEQKETVFIP